MTVDPATPTAEQIAGWVALAEKATKGPWRVYVSAATLNLLTKDNRVVCYVDDFGAELKKHDRDAAFIAAARAAVPALAAALSSERAVSAGLRAEVERLTEEMDQRLGDCVGCNYVDGPDEFCPRHGRSYNNMVNISQRMITEARGERDALQAQVQADIEKLRGDIHHLVSPIIGVLRLREVHPDVPLDLAHTVDRLYLVSALLDEAASGRAVPDEVRGRHGVGANHYPALAAAQPTKEEN